MLSLLCKYMHLGAPLSVHLPLCGEHALYATSLLTCSVRGQTPRGEETVARLRNARWSEGCGEWWGGTMGEEAAITDAEQTRTFIDSHCICLKLGSTAEQLKQSLFSGSSFQLSHLFVCI